MARKKTKTLVHSAVLSLVSEIGYGQLTMEGIAARAGVSKQTLYRSWPSKSAVILDALLERSTTDGVAIDVPDTDNLAADLETLLETTIAEMTDPAMEKLLRAITAEIQSDDPFAAELRLRLLTPQLRAVALRMSRAGITDPDEVVELLYGPVFHRWLLRTQPFTNQWVRTHVSRTLRAATVPEPHVD